MNEPRSKRRRTLDFSALLALGPLVAIAGLALGVMTRGQAILAIGLGILIWWWGWPWCKRRWRLRSLLVHELTDLPIGQLEDVVEDLFRERGYHEVRRTGDVDSDHQDVRCQDREGRELLVRTQGTVRRVGTKDVKGFARAMAHHRDVERGVLVTASTYTPEAASLARHRRIHLVDGHRLALIFAMRPDDHPAVEELIQAPLVVERHPPLVFGALVLAGGLGLAWLIWVSPIPARS